MKKVFLELLCLWFESLPDLIGQSSYILSHNNIHKFLALSVMPEVLSQASILGYIGFPPSRE